MKIKSFFPWDFDKVFVISSPKRDEIVEFINKNKV